MSPPQSGQFPGSFAIGSAASFCCGEAVGVDIRRRRSGAFTLVEMLLVLGIFSFLATIGAGAIGSLAKGKAVTQATITISGTLEQARAYAVANNTYVYVGLYEADATQAREKANQDAGTGRLFLGVAASKDGTKAIDSANLVAITRLQSFEGVTLVATGDVSTRLPEMTGGSNNVDLSDAVSTVTFPGAVVSNTQAVSVFTRVVQFSPNGHARVTASVPSYIRLAFVPAQGSHASVDASNCFGVQVDGLTGSVRVFRPASL